MIFIDKFYNFNASDQNPIVVNVLKIPKCVVESKERSIVIRKNSKVIKFKKDGDSIEIALPAN